MKYKVVAADLTSGDGEVALDDVLRKFGIKNNTNTVQILTERRIAHSLRKTHKGIYSHRVLISRTEVPAVVRFLGGTVLPDEVYLQDILNKHGIPANINTEQILREKGVAPGLRVIHHGPGPNGYSVIISKADIPAVVRFLGGTTLLDEVYLQDIFKEYGINPNINTVQILKEKGVAPGLRVIHHGPGPNGYSVIINRIDVAAVVKLFRGSAVK